MKILLQVIYHIRFEKHYVYAFLMASASHTPYVFHMTRQGQTLTYFFLIALHITIYWPTCIFKDCIFISHNDKARTSTDLFLRIGVRRGRRSLMGGVILVIPITLTMPFRAPRILPSTSGYSSPRYSYNTTPKWPISRSCNRKQK